MAKEEQYGIVVKDAQGNMYFLRPEILKATKIPKEEAENVQRLVEHQRSEVSGFAQGLSMVGTVKIGTKQTPAMRAGALPRRDTIMCGW